MPESRVGSSVAGMSISTRAMPGSSGSTRAPAATEAVQHLLVVPEHVVDEGGDPVALSLLSQLQKQQRAQPALLVGVEHGHGGLGVRGLGWVADVAGHAYTRDARGVEGERGQGEVVAVVDVGQVLEVVVGQGARGEEEAQPARLARQLLVALGQLVAIGVEQRPDEQSGPVGQLVQRAGRLDQRGRSRLAHRPLRAAGTGQRVDLHRWPTGLPAAAAVLANGPRLDRPARLGAAWASRRPGSAPGVFTAPVCSASVELVDDGVVGLLHHRPAHLEGRA